MPSRLIKPLFFFACALPMIWIVGNAFFGDLGANPVETITHQTGDWALRLLLVTLAITPLRRWTGWGWLIRLRRMSGLFVYFYASCHFLIWFLADHALDISAMAEDVIERPYITMGFTAFLFLTPLAITSNQWSIRRLGKRWQRLHRLVYVILVLAIIHFLWLVKADYLEPIVYAAIGAFLLIARLPKGLLARRSGSAQSSDCPNQKVAN